MKKCEFLIVALVAGVLLAPAGVATAQNLFEEAGHPLSRSRWIIVRHLPLIEIALESDDVVLVESIEHPPKGVAMRIDGEAVAADCRVDETKDSTYSYEISKSDDDDGKYTTGTSTSITNTTYRASCRFPQGMAANAVMAQAITVQVAMPEGTTKPHDLTAKQLKRFQKLDK